jgi:hypothetical protein
MAIEEPPFRVLQSDPPFEHRLYTGFVVAETEVVGDFDAASRSGFRRVAGYIFGDNQAQSGGNRKIEMTAPRHSRTQRSRLAAAFCDARFRISVQPAKTE